MMVLMPAMAEAGTLYEKILRWKFVQGSVSCDGDRGDLEMLEACPLSCGCVAPACEAGCARAQSWQKLPWSFVTWTLPTLPRQPFPTLRNTSTLQNHRLRAIRADS
jgi:hypothetical protein